MAFTAGTGFFENPGKPLAIIPEHLLEDTAQRFSFESHLNEIVKDAVEWMVSSKKNQILKKFTLISNLDIKSHSS
jgi:hypothetical protein